jgi:transcriptional regulator with XRE-family HTH domain
VPLNESVSANVREELKSQDVSFRELARRLGVGQPYVTRRLGEVVSEEKVELKLSELEKIADALGVPVQKFLSDEPVETGAA